MCNFQNPTSIRNLRSVTHVQLLQSIIYLQLSESDIYLDGQTSAYVLSTLAGMHCPVEAHAVLH